MQQGILFRGLSIPKCQELLPKPLNNGKEPLTEGILWLLLTDQLPTSAQATTLQVPRMYAFVRACVCVRVCMRVCVVTNEIQTYTHMHIIINSHAFTCTFTRTNTHTHIHTHACLQAELHTRASIPPLVADVIKRYPSNMHPMTQLCSAVLAMQTESEFAKVCVCLYIVCTCIYVSFWLSQWVLCVLVTHASAYIYAHTCI